GNPELEMGLACSAERDSAIDMNACSCCRLRKGEKYDPPFRGVGHKYQLRSSPKYFGFEHLLDE
ncbi:MAG: hypothetical protein ABI865_08035, partial [Nitrosospira sp.]